MFARKLTITTTRQSVLSGDDGVAGRPVQGIIFFPAALGANVYIGGPDVDTVDGFPAQAGMTLSIDLVADNVWLVSDGSADVNVLYSNTSGPLS